MAETEGRMEKCLRAYLDLFRLSRRYAGGGRNVVCLAVLAFLNVLFDPFSNWVGQRGICAECLIGGFAQIRGSIARGEGGDIDCLHTLIAGYCQGCEFALPSEERWRSIAGKGGEFRVIEQ